MNEEDLTEKPSAPLPHFEVLKKEVEDDTIRVREYLKGSLTYKVEERDALSVSLLLQQLNIFSARKVDG